MKKTLICCNTNGLDLRLFQQDTECWTVDEIFRYPLQGVGGSSMAMPAAVVGDMIYVAFRGESPALISLRLTRDRTGVEQVGHLAIEESCPYLSLSGNGRFLLAAGGTNAIVVRIGKEGVLDRVVSRMPLGELAHCVVERGGTVYGTACRDDLLRRYRLDPETGALEETAKVAFPKGSGPRHMAFSSDGRLLYVITENAGTIATLSLADDGEEAAQPRLLGAVPLLAGEGRRWSGDLALSDDGAWLFASERASDQLVSLRLDASGEMMAATSRVASPEHVRSLHLDPGGGFIVAVGNFGQSGEVYAVGADGRLTPKVTFVAGDGPSWVLGLDGPRG
nr:beta-propeller fold lactonase family protein [uncultured Cohaesibacter sp.]